MTDKTGTLTQNKMVLRGVIIADQLFGGTFGYSENGDKLFNYSKTGKNFDDDLTRYLDNENKEELPFPMDIANFKLKKGSIEDDSRDESQHNPFNIFQSSKISMNSRNTKKELNYIFSKDKNFDPSLLEFHTDNPDLVDYDHTNHPDGQEPVDFKRSLSIHNSKSFSFYPPKERNFPENYPDGTTYKTYHQITKEFILCASLCHEILVEEDKETGKKKYQGSSPDEIAICNGAKKIGSEFLGSSLGESKVDFFGEKMKFEVKMVKKNLKIF